MSQITNKDIKKIAKLARIEVSEADCDNLSKQVGGVINWVEQLGEVNTDNVEPLTNPNKSTLKMTTDKISDGNITEEVLRNAKDTKYNYFSVPKVIE